MKAKEEHYYGDLTFIGVAGYTLLPEGLYNERTKNIQRPKSGKTVILLNGKVTLSISLEMLAFCADNNIPLMTMRGKRIDTPQQREKYKQRYGNLVSRE